MNIAESDTHREKRYAEAVVTRAAIEASDLIAELAGHFPDPKLDHLLAATRHARQALAAWKATESEVTP